MQPVQRRGARPVHSTTAATGRIAMPPPPCRAAAARSKINRRIAFDNCSTSPGAQTTPASGPTSVGTAPTLVTATGRPRRNASAIATPYPSKYDVRANRSAPAHSASVTSSAKRTRRAIFSSSASARSPSACAGSRSAGPAIGQFPVEVEQPAEGTQQHVVALARDQRADRQDLAGRPGRTVAARQVVDAGDDDADPVGAARRIPVSRRSAVWSLVTTRRGRSRNIAASVACRRCAVSSGTPVSNEAG